MDGRKRKFILVIWKIQFSEVFAAGDGRRIYHLGGGAYRRAVDLQKLEDEGGENGV